MRELLDDLASKRHCELTRRRTHLLLCRHVWENYHDDVPQGWLGKSLEFQCKSLLTASQSLTLHLTRSVPRSSRPPCLVQLQPAPQAPGQSHQRASVPGPRSRENWSIARSDYFVSLDIYL